NIGGALRRQGDLPGAFARYEEALAIRRQIGQRIGEVSSLNGPGNVLLDRGELGPGRQRFSAALAVSRQIGSQSSIAYALFGLGEALAREGRLEEAGRSHQHALALRDRLGEKGTAAESRLALAALALEQGDAAKADGLAAEAAQELERQGAADGQGLALATAAQAAAARGEAARARQTIAGAAALLAHTQDLRARLTVGLRTAQLHPPIDLGQVEVAVRGVFEEATRTGLLDLRLEAGVALAAVEKLRGRAADGNALLAAIGKEAREKGYGWIAARARAVERGETCSSRRGRLSKKASGRRRSRPQKTSQSESIRSRIRRLIPRPSSGSA